MCTPGRAYAAVSLLLLAWATHAARAVEVRPSGSVAVRAASSSRSTQQLELEALLALEADTTRRCSVRGEVRLRADEADRLEPGQPRDRSWRSAVSQRAFLGNHGELELREATVNCIYRRAFLTLGKQQTVWGEADGLKVLDVVNPQSFRELWAEDFEASRIPLWTANLDLQLGSTSELQLIWIADPTVHHFPEGSDVGRATFEMASPLFRPEAAGEALLRGALDTTPEALGALPVSALANASDDPFVEALARLGVTQIALDDLAALGIDTTFERTAGDGPTAGADFGVRLKTRLGAWDLALYRLRHLDPLPLFRRSFEAAAAPAMAPQLTVAFEPTFQRVDLYGLSFANAFGAWVLRGEAAYTPDKLAQVLDLGLPSGLEPADEFAFVLGLDWRLGDTLLSAQYFETQLHDLHGLSLRGRQVASVTALAQHIFGDSSEHEIRLLWVHGLDRDDGWVQLRVRLEVLPSTRLEVAGDAFYGDAFGLFGQFDGRDRLRLGLRTRW